MAGERIRRIAAWTVAVLAVAGALGWLVTAARHAGGGSNASSGAASTGAPAPGGASAPAGVPVAGGGGIAEPSPLQGRSFGGGDGPGIGPKIVKQASIRVQVKKGSFADRFQQAISVAGAFGGYVSSSDSTVGRFRTGELVIRIPADRFEAALASLKGLGTVKNATVTGQDVTSQFVDLQARLTNWKAQEQVLLRLMAKATTVVDSIRVQQHLQDVQGTIEQIEGQLRLIGDQTAMGTITVSMAEGTPAVAAATAKPALVRAWHDATTGFVNVIAAIVVGLGYLVPLGLVVLAPWLAWRGVQRVRRRPAAAPAGG